MKLNWIITVLLLFGLAANVCAQEKGDTIKIPKFNFWIINNFETDKTEGVTSKFNLKCARLIVNGEGAKNWGYHGMIDMFDDGNARPVLMQVWIHYKHRKHLNFRFGQFKYPFGAEAYGPIPKWKFVNPSYVTSGIVKQLGIDGSIFRDIGLEAAVNYPLSDNISGIFKAMIMNGTGGNAKENNEPKDLVVYTGVKLPLNITLAGSFYLGKGTIQELDESAFGVQFMLKDKKYTAQAEYIAATYESSLGGVDDIQPNGFYAYGTYKVIPKVEFGLRYDSYERNKNAENAEGNAISNTKSRTTISAAYYLNNLNRIMLNYEIREDDLNENLDNLLTITAQAVF